MFWADRIAEEILKRFETDISEGKPILIRDEKTLSGRVHVGSMPLHGSSLVAPPTSTASSPVVPPPPARPGSVLEEPARLLLVVPLVPLVALLPEEPLGFVTPLLGSWRAVLPPQPTAASQASKPHVR